MFPPCFHPLPTWSNSTSFVSPWTWVIWIWGGQHGFPPLSLGGMNSNRDSAVVSFVGGWDRHVIGNFGCWCDHWKTLRKIHRVTNNVMIRHYRIRGALPSSMRFLRKEKKFVSVYMLATLHSTSARFSWWCPLLRHWVLVPWLISTLVSDHWRVTTSKLNSVVH